MHIAKHTMILSVLLLAYSIGSASAEESARTTEAKAETVSPAPAASPSPPSPDMILVPTRDVRDAMLYLGGRVSSDEMAAVVYRELGNAFMAAQKHAALPKQ